jgi:lipoprotein-releasing system permease protein
LPEAEPGVSEVGSHMVAGSWNLRPVNFASSWAGLAWNLGAGVGDHGHGRHPQAQSRPTGVLPRLRRFTLVGIFEVGMYEYDRGIAFMHLEDGRGCSVSTTRSPGVRIKLDDLFAAPRIAGSSPGPAAEGPSG